jgi:hypothetical protein
VDVVFKVRLELFVDGACEGGVNPWVEFVAVKWVLCALCEELGEGCVFGVECVLEAVVARLKLAFECPGSDV